MEGGKVVELEVGGGIEDPLEDYKGLSLFRRSFPSLPLPPSAAGDNSDLLSSHNFLLSLPLKDAEMLAEQGKAVLEAGGGGNDGARARRPGLGIKRTRTEFRLRVPESGDCKENEVAEPIELDIDKFKDPEKLFSAFERLQNAKREIAKQTGRVLVKQQYSTTWDPRPRRPGLPGRSKTREYKHLFPAMNSQDSSQENITIAIETGLRQESVENEPEGKEGTNDDVDEGGGEAAPENQVSKILDELLSCDDEDLDGDGAVNLLRDRLQIKPASVEMFELPKMLEVRRSNLNISHGERRKRSTTLSDMHNVLKEPRIDFKKKKSWVSLANSASPTPPRSPMAALSLLRRNILQSDPISDPFSITELANSPLMNDSSIKDIDKGSEVALAAEEFRDSTYLECPSHQSMGDDMPSLPLVRDADGVVKEKSSLADTVTETDMQNENTQIEAPRSPVASSSLLRGSLMQSDSISDPFSITDLSNSLQKNDSAIKYIDKGSETVHADVEFRDSTFSKSPPYQSMGDDMSSLPSVRDVDGVVKEKSSLVDTETDMQKEATQIEALSGSHTNLNFAPAPAQHDKEKPESSTTSSKKPTKAKSKPRKERQKREVSRRRSLAGSGTSWQQGIRRSTRIKSRPLEFWKGERFLYGRIHESLATVIGIKKFDTPANAKRSMKVKSFVSEEFKDFVDLAALG